MLHLNEMALDHQEFCWQVEDKHLPTLTCSCPGILQPCVKSCCRQRVWSWFYGLYEGYVEQCAGQSR